MNKQTIHEWEIRLNSNVMALQDYLRDHPDFLIMTAEDNNGENPLTLGDIIEDLDDIRMEIEEEDENTPEDESTGVICESDVIRNEDGDEIEQ